MAHATQSAEGGNNELVDLDEKEQGILTFPEGDDPQVFDEDDSLIRDALQDEERTENLLAEEFKKLSLVEHEKILFDVHGLPQMDQEDPENVRDLMEEMETCINKIRQKSSYNKAKYLDEKGLATDPAFRLMFLRCDRFDSKLAAQRIVRHFEIKEKLFGDGEILARDVRLSDLSEEDMKALESGFVQIMPYRDAAGRSIFHIAPRYRPDEMSYETHARISWYMLNTTMKDEETQRKGVVGIVSNFGHGSSVEAPLKIFRQLRHIRSGIPKKLTGFHFCCDDAAMRPFVAGISLFMPTDLRARFRSHFGDREEIEFNLQTFGIPTKDHPILSNGELSLEWHLEWLEIRRIQEESDSVKDGVIIPRRFDVLFGRGKNTREHTGNLRAAHLVEMHQAEYEKAGKFEKTAIAERIIGIIHDSLGRFLKWEKTGWVEADQEAAREKISHFFRHLRSKVKEQPSCESISTSELSTKRVTPCPSPLLSANEHVGKSVRGDDGGKVAV